jgi:hypothetical protein
MLECGDTFLTGDDEDEGYHLWIVLTPPSEGEVVTVSVTTLRKRSEKLVVLQAQDHPFIEHPSVIAYTYSRIRTVQDIEAALANGTAKRREPASRELLEKVRAGLVDSDFTPNGVRHFYNDVMKDFPEE